MPVGNVTFFIGYNRNDLKPYVTFFKRNGDKDYSWLRSFDDLFSAQKDVIDRAYREIPNLDFNLVMKEKTIYGDKT